MNKQLKLGTLAAAVLGAYAGGAWAQIPAGTYHGAGATAPINGLRGAIFTNANACNATVGGAIVINYYENATVGAAAFSGSVFAIGCPAGTNALVVQYDSTGGSWKGLTVHPNLFTAAQADPTANSPNFVLNIPSLAACTAHGTATDSYTGITVNLFQGCTTAKLAAAPDFGFTDVETPLFQGSIVNQPVLAAAVSTFSYSPTTWELDPSFVADTTGAEGNGAPTGVFGIVFGVAASSTLYQDLQLDQASLSGPLPSACKFKGTTSPPCVPNITQAQYRSLAQEAGSNLNLGTIAQLFPNLAALGQLPSDLTVTLARRDQGSGTQATSNSYFFHLGCGPVVELPDLSPALVIDSAAGYTVQYNQTTGGVTTALGGVGNVIGVVSTEKDGTLPNGAGFLKLDGVYPSNVNAALGLYNMVSQEQLHSSATANAALITALTSATEAYVNTGIVPTFTHNGVWPNLNLNAKGNPQLSYYNNNNNNCSGWRSY